MTTLLVDTSVVIKWFHSERESEVAEARALRDAHERGEVEAYVLDLAIYELGNVLLRSLRWTAQDVDAQLSDLLLMTPPPLAMQRDWIPIATTLAARHRLTFYDAAWAATAEALGIPLVSADRALLAAGLAENARSVATRLGLIG